MFCSSVVAYVLNLGWFWIGVFCALRWLWLFVDCCLVAALWVCYFVILFVGCFFIWLIF